MTVSEPRPPQTLRIATPDAELHVEVRGHGPTLVLFGCPMGADAFASLAEVLGRDFTVITADPRGIKRSTVVDRNRDVTPEVLADDLSVILNYLGAEPAAVFGSSGGAVAALALLQRYPERVRHVIAHEPPLEELLDDHEQLRSNTEDVVQTYLGGDVVGAWRKFFVSAKIEMDDHDIAGWINGRTEPQEAADEQFFFAHTLRPSTYWIPDLATLASRTSLVTVGVGRESAGQVCDRATSVLAAALGITRTVFAGDHTGFVDDPSPFAEQIREILRK